MLLKYENNVLVILGGWNANILLNVRWLKRYLFPENENFKVEMPINLSLPGPPQISTDSVKLSLMGGKLSFSPLREGDSLLDDIEELGKRVADFLPHTPVSAIGINFLFEEGEDDKRLTWSSRDGEEKLKSIGSINEELHRYSFFLEECTLNFAIQRLADGRQTYDFNFHHQVQTLADIKEIFTKKHIIEYKRESEEYLAKLLENNAEKGDDDE